MLDLAWRKRLWPMGHKLSSLLSTSWFSQALIRFLAVLPGGAPGLDFDNCVDYLTLMIVSVRIESK